MSGTRPLAHTNQSAASPSAVASEWLWTWWRALATVRPGLPPLAGWSAGPGDDQAVRQLSGWSQAEIDRLRAAGHRPYVAWLADQPVAFGWCATTQAGFGSPTRPFVLPLANRYLWAFATQRRWRGQGIYPRLLQTILDQEIDGERFWLLHRAANVASARGIARAGFLHVGTISQPIGTDQSVLLPTRPPHAQPTYAQTLPAGAALLGLPLITPASER